MSHKSTFHESPWNDFHHIVNMLGIYSHHNNPEFTQYNGGN